MLYYQEYLYNSFFMLSIELPDKGKWKWFSCIHRDKSADYITFKEFMWFKFWNWFVIDCSYVER